MVGLQYLFALNWTFGMIQKLSNGYQTLDMTSEGLGEMFEGDFADM